MVVIMIKFTFKSCISDDTYFSDYGIACTYMYKNVWAHFRHAITPKTLFLLFLVFFQVEEDEPSDFVRFDKFQPVMIKIITERRYRPSTEEQLVKAFEVNSPTHVCTYTAQKPWVCSQTSVVSERVLCKGFD